MEGRRVLPGVPERLSRLSDTGILERGVDWKPEELASRHREWRSSLYS